MAARPRILMLTIASLFLASLLSSVATATHWVADTDVTVSPVQSKADRTVNFQITVENSGPVPLTVCEVEITFEWDPTPRSVFSGLEDIPSGGSKTWTIDETIPALLPKSYRETVTIVAKALPLDIACAGSDWDRTIEIVPNVPPVASFTFAPTNPAANTTVYFNDQSTDSDGSIVSWHWDFGDGEFANGRDETHQFRSSGVFPVVLTVTDDDGATHSASETVSIAPNVRPIAAFSYSPTNVRLGAVVQFSDDSSDPDGTVVGWYWDFGDETNSTTRDPTHRFTSPGMRSVLMIVTDNAGSTDSVSQNVQVVGNVAPVSNFSFSPASANTSTVTYFVDRSSDVDGSIVAWRWDFGDGTNSTGRNPSHQYATPGDYQVSLTVTDNEGSTDLVIRTVRIGSIPSAGGPTTAASFGYVEWGLIAVAAAAIGVVVFIVVKRKFRPRRRWGQSANHTPPADSKSRWRPR